MIFFIFLAACWGCEWCFDHNHPELGILTGCLFAAFYLIDRWSDRNSPYLEVEEIDDEF